MDKQELFDKAVEIALSRELIKDSGDVDPDKSGEVVGFYRLVTADKKVLARISMNDIEGWSKRRKIGLGCWILLIGAPVWIVVAAMISAVFIPAFTPNPCKGKSTGDVAIVNEKEIVCRED